MIHPFILNPFPDLLSFGLLSATLLRVVVGVLFIRYGYIGLKADNSINTAGAWVQVLGGVALVLGLYTQIAAMILFFVVLSMWANERKNGKLSSKQSDLYVLLAVICLSLLITGAGLFGFDLPL